MSETSEITDLRNPSVTDKYREAAKIAQQTLNAVLSQIADGKSIVEICEFADALVERQSENAFKKERIDKGIAFPTCLSVNEVVGHFSPLRSDEDAKKTLKAGDLVKIDLGAHIDGYIATVAYTAVVGGGPLKGPAADVITAAHAASEAALRMIRPGNTNKQVTDVVNKVCRSYGVVPVSGVLMHETKRYLINGSKAVLLRDDDPEVRIEEVTFEANEVYSVDVIVSSGEGKPRETEMRTTIFKLDADSSYRPKMKAAQALHRQVLERFTVMPFTLRAFESESSTRMGILELAKHGAVSSYPVLAEKEGAFVAQVKVTALLLPGGTLKITGLPAPAALVTDKKVPDDIRDLLATEPYVKRGQR